jgi:Ca2+-transporting ATPase
LWINLVTDGLPGLALASEPAEGNVIAAAKGPTTKHFLLERWHYIISVGLLMGLVTLGIQYWAIHANIPHWQTIALRSFVLVRWAMSWQFVLTRISLKLDLFKSFRGATLTVFLQLMIIYVPFFNVIFKTQPLSLYELILTLLSSSIVFWAVEIAKWILRRKK